MQDILSLCINTVNEAQRNEILSGYDYQGVHYDLTETDQLNYNSIMNIVNSGEPEVTIYGETDTDKYHGTVFTNEEASVFLKSMFSHVAAIIERHRAIKKALTEANEEDYEQILIDSGISHAEEAPSEE
jgi:hypothetical protein